MSKKKVMGENKIDCHPSALNYRNCEHCLFKHILWTRFNFNKSRVALNGRI